MNGLAASYRVPTPRSVAPDRSRRPGCRRLCAIGSSSKRASTSATRLYPSAPLPSPPDTCRQLARARGHQHETMMKSHNSACGARCYPVLAIAERRQRAHRTRALPARCRALSNTLAPKSREPGSNYFCRKREGAFCAAGPSSRKSGAAWRPRVRGGGNTPQYTHSVKKPNLKRS